jgi:hypothetical protein
VEAAALTLVVAALLVVTLQSHPMLCLLLRTQLLLARAARAALHQGKPVALQEKLVQIHLLLVQL